MCCWRSTQTLVGRPSEIRLSPSGICGDRATGISALRVGLTVKGGYSPTFIRATSGTPLRLRFDRQENSNCTARVVFPDFRLSKSLPPFRTTTVELTPEEMGEYAFAWREDMLHGPVSGHPGLESCPPPRDPLNWPMSPSAVRRRGFWVDR